MPIIQGGIVGTTWGTWRRKAVSIAGLIAAVTGAIVGVAKAAPVIEPWWYASHAYVQEQLAEHIAKVQLAQNKVERVLQHIQIEQAEGKKEAVDNDLFKAQLEMKKTQDPTTQEFIVNQINKLQMTKSKIENQIQTLNRSQP